MEHWEIYASAIGTIVIVIGLVLAMGKECRSQVGRMYRRFDEFKDTLRDSHVSKETFSLVHKQLLTDLHEIKGDLKTLLRNGKNKSD